MARAALQSEILLAIRGKLSTSALSRQLGYGFNQVARWEKGERRLPWADFAAVCGARRRPLREQLKLYLGYEGDPRNTTALMDMILSGKSIDATAKASNLSRSKISRWRLGKAAPTFIDVYDLLVPAVNVLAFLEPLVNLAEVPQLAKQYGYFRQQRELIFALPFLDVLMEALLVRKYSELPRHDAGTLAAVAGLPLATVERALASLDAAGMIERKAGKYHAVEVGVDYRADRKRMAEMLGYWLGETKRVVPRLGQGPLDGSAAAFTIFSLSPANHEKALALFRDFHRALHELGSGPQVPREKVLVLTSALFDAASFG